MTTINNGIIEFISNLEKGAFIFKPSHQFYEDVQIKRKRWGQIYRDEQTATIVEMQNIAKYFDAKFNHSIIKIKSQIK